jgi:hypothetical protein
VYTAMNLSVVLVLQMVDVLLKIVFKKKEKKRTKKTVYTEGSWRDSNWMLQNRVRAVPIRVSHDIYRLKTGSHWR